MNRRQFTKLTGVIGVGAWSSLALSGELETLQRPHRPATAHSVIMLFMSGGPSQVDTFDPKPELAKLEGQDVPDSIARHVPKIKRAGLKNLMASPWSFQNFGESGMPISELFP
ncbi:MAG: DUF1501 domain-containing protein, partial [Planctomycetaceae bacterium]|nr:DUF1501 domain-containing protein [Planctomycetaceae bacterium]